MRTNPYTRLIGGLFSSILLLIAPSHSIAQEIAGDEAKHPPEAGLTVEPIIENEVREFKFTNSTDRDLRIAYGDEKFRLKAGESRFVPVPVEDMVDLKVAESFGEGKPVRMRFSGKARPNDPKRFIPFDWAEVQKP